ncbi:MAG: hypothetical protein H0X64_07710, partial [Gemmatimonadaceae bacterium]|nr:hypothetical protein [Gemmatimonadaceae bacterium]
TDSVGRFSIRAPGGRTFELRAHRIGYYAFATLVRFDSDSSMVYRELTLTRAAVALPVVTVRDRRPVARPPAVRTPGGQDDPERAANLAAYPLTPGSLGEIAALTPGGYLTGDPPVPVLSAQPPAHLHTTLDGASFGATTLPSEALGSIATIASSFDPARGNFSAGQLAATTLSGTNVFGASVRARVGAGSSGAPPPPSGPGHGSVSMGAGGPLARDVAFWYIAAEAGGRRSRLVTFDRADGGELESVGLDVADVIRLRDALAQVGVPIAARSPTVSDVRNASALARLDLILANDHVLMLRGDSRRTVVRGAGERLTALSGSGVTGRQDAAGALAQLTSYLGGWRNELRATSRKDNTAWEPATAAPGGEVWAQPLDAAVDKPVRLRFGGSAAGRQATVLGITELSNDVTLPLGANHRGKIGVTYIRERPVVTSEANALGTFHFADIASLQAGVPSLFVRTLGTREGVAVSVTEGAYAAHLWRSQRSLSTIWGARLERRRYSSTQAGAQPPTEVAVSPRIGITLAPPRAPWGLRFGTGLFHGRIPPTALAFGAADRASTARVLQCPGAKAPRPDWRLFHSDLSHVPQVCAGGDAATRSDLPSTLRYAGSAGAPRLWRTQLGGSWTGSITSQQVGITAELGVSSGHGLPLARDANRAGAFGVLAGEGGRPLYAPLEAIDPETGQVPLHASRRDASLGVAREIHGGGRSLAAETTIRGFWWRGSASVLFASYTHTMAWDEVSALDALWQGSAAVGGLDPARIRAISDLERRHSVQLQYTHKLPRLSGEVSVTSRASSGRPFTPSVFGDVNGDGSHGDVAFVFDTAGATHPEIRGAIRTLLLDNGAARGCLGSQLGRIAERNSCHGGWTADADLQADFWPRQERVSRRITVTLTATNLLGAFSNFLASRDEWPDPTLLIVNGFDPATGSYRYAVNGNFARDAGNDASRRRATLAVQVRWTPGVDPARQPMVSRVAAMRTMGRTAADVAAELRATFPNLAMQALLLADTLQLALATAQVDRLIDIAEQFARDGAPVIEAIAAAVVAYESADPARSTAAARERRDASVRDAQALLDATLDAMREVLTPAQWNRLPIAIREPARQLIVPRRGIDPPRSEW